MKKILAIFNVLLLAGILTFTGCSNPLSETTQQAENAKGILQIQINGAGDARTLAPDVAGFDSYELQIETASEILVKESVTTAGASKELTPGSYIITVTGLVDGKPSAKGSATVVIKAGKPESVNIILSDVADVSESGIFTYSITFPEDLSNPNIWYDDGDGYKSTTLTLEPSGSNSGTVSITGYPVDLRDKTVVTVDGGNYIAAGSIELPPGKYQLAVDLVSNREIAGDYAGAYVRETVYVFPHLTTVAAATFVEDDFVAQVYLAGTASVANYYTDTTNTNYQPKEVYLSLVEALPENEYEYKAAVTLNPETFNYEWNMTLPSHKVAAGLTSSRPMSFYLRAEDDEGNAIFSNWRSFSGVDKHGKTDISINITVRRVSSPDDRIVVKNGRSNEQTDFATEGESLYLVITPEGNEGLIDGTLRWWSFYNNGNIGDIQNQYDGTLKAWFTMPNTDTTVYGEFFTLGGDTYINANSAGYHATKVEVFAESDFAEAPLIATGTVTGNTAATANPWTVTAFSNNYYKLYSGRVYLKATWETTTTPEVNVPLYTTEGPRSISSFNGYISTEIYEITLPEGVSNGTITASPASRLATKGTPVTLKVAPSANYGFIANTLSYSPTTGGSSVPVGTPKASDADGSVSYTFTMPEQDITVREPTFFTFSGSVSVAVPNETEYAPIEVTVLDDNAGNWQGINSTATIAAETGDWNIPVPEAYKAIDSNKIFHYIVKIKNTADTPVEKQYVFSDSFDYYSAPSLVVPSPDDGVPTNTTGYVYSYQRRLFSIAFSWYGVSNANGYNIYRGSENTPLNSTPVYSTSYTDTNLLPGTNYTYRVTTLSRFELVTNSGNKPEESSGTTRELSTQAGTRVALDSWSGTLTSTGGTQYHYFDAPEAGYYVFEGRDRFNTNNRTADITGFTAYNGDITSSPLVNQGSTDLGDNNNTAIVYVTTPGLIAVSVSASESGSTYELRVSRPAEITTTWEQSYYTNSGETQYYRIYLPSYSYGYVELSNSRGWAGIQSAYFRNGNGNTYQYSDTYWRIYPQYDGEVLISVYASSGGEYYIYRN
jgi:hypothetical protein